MRMLALTMALTAMTALLAIAADPPAPAAAADGALHLNLRSRKPPSPAAGPAVASETKADWSPKKTAIIVCDMWDDHWCKSAAARVGELAGPLNDMLKAARAKGVFIIHAPS